MQFHQVPKETNVGTGMVGAPACGDVMKLQIKCEPKGNTHIIKDVKFKTYGCGSAIASASELVDMLIGKTLEEAKAIKNVEIVEALELPPIKIHCSVLAEDSIRQAIEDYESIKIWPHEEICPNGAEIESLPDETICEAALRNNIKIEHACEMSCACTTCHCIIRKGFDSLDEASDMEEDLLDKAWGLEQTSRLSCQTIPPDNEEIEIELPKYNINMVH